MNDCLFCKITKGEIPSNKVYENKEFVAFLDIEPVAPGHTIVIPKEHFPKLTQTNEETLEKLLKIVVKIVPGILKATHSTGYNVVINTEKEAGQIIFHTHVHIVPRKEGDGLRFWQKHIEEEADLKALAGKIRENIQLTQ
jgi:histidine triad (HIT) family protein